MTIIRNCRVLLPRTVMVLRPLLLRGLVCESVGKADFLSAHFDSN